jgi:hypothetical protein
MIDKKTEHFPIRKHILAPFMEMLASTAELSLKTPQLFQENGEKSPKNPPFSISSLPLHVRDSQEK